MKRKIKISISVLTILLCVCCVFAIVKFISNSRFISYAETNSVLEESNCVVGEESISFEFGESRFEGNFISVAYVISDTVRPISVIYESNGLKVTKCQLADNRITIFADYEYEVGDHFLSLDVLCESGENLFAQLWKFI